MILRVIYSVYFMDALCTSLMLPLIGPHILNLGGSYFIIGCLGSLNAAIQLLSGPVVGSLSDHQGRKLPLLYTLLFVLLLNIITANTTSIPSFVVLRSLNVLFAKTPLLLKALVADNVQSSEHTSVYVKMGAIGGVSFIIGPVIGGHLFEYVNGFNYVLYIISSLTFFTMGLVTLLPNDKCVSQEQPQVEEDEKPTPIISYVCSGLTSTFSKLKNVNWAVFWDLFTFKFLTETTFALFYYSFGLLLLEKFRTDQKFVGYTMAFQAFTAICFSLLHGQVRKYLYSNDQFGQSQIMHAFTGLTLSIFGSSVVSNYWLFVASLVPHTVSRVLFDTVWIEVLLIRASVGEKGSLLGASDSLVAFAGLATPFLSGTIAQFFGNNVVIMVAIIPVLVGTILSNKIKFVNVRNDCDNVLLIL